MSAEIVHRLEDGRIFTDMVDDGSNPCVACGACCTGVRVSFYQGEVRSMGGEVPDDWVTRLSPFLVCMKGTELGTGACGALAGQVGHPGIRCLIYPVRSSTCRAFRVWDDDGSANRDCIRLRDRFGLPPVPHKLSLSAE